VIPGGLTTGIAGLMLAIMVGASMYRQRPLPVTAGGLIGVGVVSVTCYLKGLMNHEIASAVIFVTSGCIASVAFSIFLDRELRQRHSLEVSLAKEKEQSEALLKEILPRYAIQKIHEGADTIAETISEVNIIFIDIVGFSAMSRELAPKRLVEILGEFFRCLDDLCAQHGVTKIKTIGDAYMAATGAPEPSSLSAIGAVEFCLSAIKSVSEIASRREMTRRVRAGIATGEVISGVLGLKRPAYDLWGETVNLASRMENTADPGTVQIDEKTFLRVNDRFVCSPRGLVEAKGFGPVHAYRISAHAAIT
jgi:class 3 adenylate cyclase